MIPTSILAAQIVISLKSKTTPNIKSKNINVTTNINKSRFLSITFFSFTPPTQTSTAHTANVFSCSSFLCNHFYKIILQTWKFNFYVFFCTPSTGSPHLLTCQYTSTDISPTENTSHLSAFCFVFFYI